MQWYSGCNVNLSRCVHRKEFYLSLSLVQQGGDIMDKRLLTDIRSLLWANSFIVQLKPKIKTDKQEKQSIRQPGDNSLFPTWKMWEVKMVPSGLMSVFHNHNTVDVSIEGDITKI